MQSATLNPARPTGTAGTGILDQQNPDRSTHRIVYPVRAESAQPEPTAAEPPPADPAGFDLAAFSQTVAGDNVIRQVPIADRPRYRAMTLRQFYEDEAFGPRVERLASVKHRSTAAGTAQKDCDALSLWERFCGRPPGMAFGERFGGCFIGSVTDKYATEFIGRAMEGLSHDYVRGLWNHLRWMFNEAVRLAVLPTAPQVTAWPKKQDSTAADDLTTIYEQPGRGINGTLQAVHEALRISPDLQDAFQFAVSMGARPVDWSHVRWKQLRLEHERPLVSFTARKTSKFQAVPLGPSVVAMLQRRRSRLLSFVDDALVFPGLTNTNHKEPEKSAAARKRTALLKAAIESVGLDTGSRFKRPWQAARATCNERLERQKPGAGQFVLGHSSTLNSKSYREPSGMVFDAVVNLEQPDCWKV